jgi:hypothetical protein
MAHPGIGLLAEARSLQLLEETTEAAAHRASGSGPATEHLPQHVADPTAGARCEVPLGRRATARSAIRQHPEDDRHQRDEHLAHAGASTSRACRLLLGPTAHPLSAQSTEKIVQKSHVNLL